MKRNSILTLMALGVLFVVLYAVEGRIGPYWMRILNVGAVYSILAVSLNLVFGFTGQFSLGHAGFMAVGAYVTALLTLSPVEKATNFYILPIIQPLQNVQWPFLPALLLGALFAALFGLLIGLPVLRLRGDYLGMATLGFSEIVRVVINNLQSITNGSLGLKGLPEYTNSWWAFGALVVSVSAVTRLLATSYGRAFKAVREDEIAAEVIGIRLTFHKTLSFTVAAFFAGLAGGLLGHLTTGIDPKMFMSLLTFQIVMIVVIGGLGSITGSVIAGILYALAIEWLRFIEAPLRLGSLVIPGVPGMRMVIFSLMLLVVILRYRRGMFGDSEFSWDGLLSLGARLRARLGGGVSR